MDYGHSTDVLGRVVEIVSGQSLFQFEKARLLDPLGMTETAFFLADDTKRPRVAEPLPADRFKGPIAGIKDPILPRRWESGGAGMIGTIADYARFAQMLLNRGALDGRRYLKPKTVALMTSDHIGPETKIARDRDYFPGETSGFGLGFAVRTASPANRSWPLGEYRWDGVGGTFFFIDPNDDMFAICMMQSPSQRERIQMELKGLIYQALGSDRHTRYPEQAMSVQDMIKAIGGRSFPLPEAAFWLGLAVYLALVIGFAWNPTPLAQGLAVIGILAACVHAGYPMAGRMRWPFWRSVSSSHSRWRTSASPRGFPSAITISRSDRTCRVSEPSP